MAEIHLRRAGERFESLITQSERHHLESASTVDKLRVALKDIEQHLAASKKLRNLERITPFIDAVERLSKPMGVLANGTPFLPFIWAPINFIVLLAQSHAYALDKILKAYANIGTVLPRLDRYSQAFPSNHSFQLLLSHLFEDILEFHARAYGLLRKPGWKVFFTSGWSRAEHHFGSLLDSIARYSELVDKEAAWAEVEQARAWRTKVQDDAKENEKRWEIEQRGIVLQWLQSSHESGQEHFIEWLSSRSCEGTGNWLTNEFEIRNWLQRGRGSKLLWLNGKPGSGKSVLCSQLISFLRSTSHRACLFFFCSFHTSNHEVTCHILRELAIQIVFQATDLVPYVYDECVAKGQPASVTFLMKLLPTLFTKFEDLTIVVDGVDEISASEHGYFIKSVTRLVEGNKNCRLLISSQNIPTISNVLKKARKLSLASKIAKISNDMEILVKSSLEEINNRFAHVLPESFVEELKQEILDKAEGMFLWVHLVLQLLQNASNMHELRQTISSLPKDLAEAYQKILTSIQSRGSSGDVAKLRRVFGWMVYAKGNRPLRRFELRLAMVLYEGHYTLTEETKPFPNALDICRPLIEDGPGATVIFVHSTVPQFLIQDISGPFLRPLQSQRDIAIACVSQLISSLEFSTDSQATSHHLHRISHGLHALLPYAHEYWVDHVCDYFEARKFESSPDFCPVTHLLSNLLVAHGPLPAELWQGVQYQGHALDSRLEALNTFPSLQSLIGAVAMCRQFAQQQNAEDRGQSSFFTDLSPLESKLRFASSIASYRHLSATILTQAMHGLIPDDVAVLFAEEFGSTAYLCDIPGCEYCVVGLSSPTALKDHQAQHQGLLRCVEPGCIYDGDVGFASIRSLRAHQRKLHSLDRAPKKRIPRTIREITGDKGLVLAQATVASEEASNFDFDAFVFGRHDAEPGYASRSVEGPSTMLREATPDWQLQPIYGPPRLSPSPIFGRSLLGAQSPPLAPPSRQPLPMHQGPPAGHGQEPYGNPPPQSSTPHSAAPAAPRIPEVPKTSSIMSLLNDDPPPAPKRVSDVSGRPTSTTQPPLQMRREEPYLPYPRGDPRGGGISAMPSPTPRSSLRAWPPLRKTVDWPSQEREYYRSDPYQSGGTDSPQGQHRYPSPTQPSHYQPQ